MSTQVLIMTFDRKQLDFILSNFELFSSDEVRVAAKQLAQKNKDLAVKNEYERLRRALSNHDGFNQGLISDPLGLGRIF